MLLHDLLRDSARRFPDKVGIIVSNRSYRFREIHEASDRLACEFQRLGLHRGDRVAAMLDNSFEMVVALWGALKAGAVFVPISPTIKADKLSFLLADSGSAAFIASGVSWALYFATASFVFAVVVVLTSPQTVRTRSVSRVSRSDTICRAA